MKVFDIGTSTLGLPISAHQLGRGPKKLVVIAGMHGDEIESIHLAHALTRELFNQNFEKEHTSSIIVIPVLNPDGFSLARRWTSTGVDLNRNFPSNDWTPHAHSDRYPPGKCAASEPETKSLVTFLEKEHPVLVLDLHSYCKSVLMPTWAEKELTLRPLAQSLVSATGIELEETSLGYPVHGGLHSWCLEHNIAHFTFELLRDISQKSIEAVYLEPSLHFINCALQINTKNKHA